MGEALSLINGRRTRLPHLWSFRSLFSQTEGLSQKVHARARHFMCLQAALRKAAPSHYQRMRETTPLWLTGWRRMKTRRLLSASGRGGTEMRFGGGRLWSQPLPRYPSLRWSVGAGVEESCHQVWDDGKIMRVVAWRPGVWDVIHVRFSTPSLTVTCL